MAPPRISATAPSGGSSSSASSGGGASSSSSVPSGGGGVPSNLVPFPGPSISKFGPRGPFEPGKLIVADGGCLAVNEIAAASFDSDLTGVTSSPYSGDMGSTGVIVPVAATSAPDAVFGRQRYLVRLCGVEIPAGYAIVIRGLRQLATIRGCTGDTDDEAQPCLLTLEREIVSPLWRFLDGNISWHLRWQQNRFGSSRMDPLGQLPGTSPNTRSLNSALLYVPPLAPLYRAPAAGVPPGNSVGAFGTFRDIRFPWENTDWSMHEVVRGPGAVAFYASIWQTNPTGRPVYPNLPGMRPEDQFLSSFPNARYGRVAGALIFEAFPCCEGEGPVVP